MEKVDSIWAYDIETLFNCFTCTFKNRTSGEIRQFVVHESRYELDEFIEFLKSRVTGLIGYNNVNFDYPVIHFILTNFKKLKNPKTAANIIYQKAQETIKKEFSAIWDNQVLIPQIDLFRIWHFDNKNKSTSLKDLEFVMRMENVQEMPIEHYNSVNADDISLILEYNLNDVNATLEFYERSRDKINLRKSLGSKYHMNFLNASNSKIGSELLLELYCQKTGLDKVMVRKMRTYRPKIKFSECILPNIEFKSDVFKNFLSGLRKKEVVQTKGAFEASIVFKGFKYDYGLGGIHGSARGVFEADDEYCIIDADVASLYPSLGIVNGLYPEHLGKPFYFVYKEDIVDVRLAEKALKEKGDKAIVDGFKEAANSAYGKSNDFYSWLYDPKYTLTTTMNGQLQLTMLAEDLVMSLDNVTVMQINTDGITIKLKRSQVDRYYEICNAWMEKTKLLLEFKEYNKYLIRDVNNYLAFDTKNNSKLKGYYEINKEYHKDHSFRIIPIAIYEHFTKGIPVQDVIDNIGYEFEFEGKVEKTSIFDYFGKYKATRGWEGRTIQIINNDIVVQKQQRVSRYLVTKSGASFVKVNNDGRSIKNESGWNITIMNKFIKKDDYGVDFPFYKHYASEEILKITYREPTLF